MRIRYLIWPQKPTVPRVPLSSVERILSEAFQRLSALHGHSSAPYICPRIDADGENEPQARNSDTFLVLFGQDNVFLYYHKKTILPTSIQRSERCM